MNKSEHKFDIPTVMILLGITGDLVRRKILHALFKLYKGRFLPEKFQVYGFARRDYTDETIREYLRQIMVEKEFGDEHLWDDFLDMFFYQQGTFDNDSSYDQLAKRMGLIDENWSICSNKLFYFAVPPKHYETIIMKLDSSHLTKPCSEDEGFTRVILEKPFGSDYESAHRLDQLLGDTFKEEQIYRVDHYLGKETVRNILAFRFGNSFLAPNWTPQGIKCIEVNMYETIDVSERVEFYDDIGAFRDFGKNHMMQLLALFTMSHPESFDPEEIRTKRSEVFDCLRCLKPEDIAQQSARAQYEGYTDTEGVAPDSMTETYFEVKTQLQSGPLKGVPVIFRHGKALKKDLKEVKVTFSRNASMDLFGNVDDNIDNRRYENVLHYHISPDESIKIRFFVKKPGHKDHLDRQNFGFSYEDVYGKDAGVEAYEQLLLDIVEGDQTLFVSTKEIMKQWQFVEPLLKTWKTGLPKMKTYKRGTLPNLLGED